MRKLDLTPEERLARKREKSRRNRKAWMKRNPGKHRAYMREKYRNDPVYRAKVLAQRCPERDRRARLLRVYGITPEDYEDILEAQDGKCGICHGPVAKRKDKFGSIDHDHSKQKGDPGFIRGILCADCNLSIGKLKDNPEIIRRALSWCTNFIGGGISLNGMKLEEWRSNNNHLEHHFFIPGDKKSYQSSHYVFGINPQMVSEETVIKIMELIKTSQSG